MDDAFASFECIGHVLIGESGKLTEPDPPIIRIEDEDFSFKIHSTDNPGEEFLIEFGIDRYRQPNAATERLINLGIAVQFRRAEARRLHAFLGFLIAHGGTEHDDG